MSRGVVLILIATLGVGFVLSAPSTDEIPTDTDSSSDDSGPDEDSVLKRSLWSAEQDEDEEYETYTETFGDGNNDTKGKDLIVIKSVVYEVGFLTDADSNETSASNETEEQVDLSFFNPGHNGSSIDLSRIPIPIQTQVNGVTVTGVLPAANLGSILLGPDGRADLNGSALALLFPDKQVVVRHNVTTVDKRKGKDILEDLGEFLGFKDVGNNRTSDKGENRA